MDHNNYINELNKINGNYKCEIDYQNYVQSKIFVGSITEISINDEGFNNQKDDIDFLTQLTNKIYKKFNNMWRIDMNYKECWFEFKISNSGKYSKNLRHIYDFIKCILLITLGASNNVQSSMVCFSKNKKYNFFEITYFISILDSNEIIFISNNQKIILNLNYDYEIIKNSIIDIINNKNYIVFNLNSISSRLNIDKLIENLVNFIHKLLENIFYKVKIDDLDFENLDLLINKYEELDKNPNYEFDLDNEFEKEREIN